MAHELLTLTGNLEAHGRYTEDEHVHTYDSLEFTTDAGAVQFDRVIMSNECARALNLRTDDHITVKYTTVAANRTVFWAIRNDRTRRVFVDEAMYAVRQTALNQALAFSFITFIGYLALVLPGLLLTWPLVKMWSAVGKMPTPEVIKAEVEALNWPPVLVPVAA